MNESGNMKKVLKKPYCLSGVWAEALFPAMAIVCNGKWNFVSC